MKSSLLMWRFFTLIMVTDCVTVLLLPSKEQLELSSLHLTVLQRNFSRATSAPNAHKTEEILSTSGHESTTPCSGIAISAHGITHSFLFGTKIDTSFSSLTAFCTLSNKNKDRIEFCSPSPPNLRHATFKAITYEMGTLINCECKKGFRRSSKTIFMNCTGNASHSAWENQCQCTMNSLGNTQKQATPKPEEQKERKTAEMQSQTQPTDQVDLGHCREPPPWEHEASKRIYHFVVGQTVHYKCAQGFRAKQKGPATSTCKMICGETRWTQPQLKCTSDEEFPAITDIPSGSEASCPFTTTSITTDFQKPTEVSTTTEMFIFTTEYQIAVAGCILLLISIFLLSVLTWQRRRRKSRRTL